MASVRRQVLLALLGLVLITIGAGPKLSGTLGRARNNEGLPRNDSTQGAGPNSTTSTPAQNPGATAANAPDSKPKQVDEANTPTTSHDGAVTPAQPMVVKRMTMQPGSGFLFGEARATSGMGADRDIWWNRVEFVPGSRMYSLGTISNVRDVVQIATGHFEFRAFEPHLGEGYAVEITRDGRSYAIVQVLALGDAIELEWLYPYRKQVVGQ
jgi:hypothetical protein